MSSASRCQSAAMARNIQASAATKEGREKRRHKRKTLSTGTASDLRPTARRQKRTHPALPRSFPFSLSLPLSPILQGYCIKPWSFSPRQIQRTLRNLQAQTIILIISGLSLLRAYENGTRVPISCIKPWTCSCM